MVVDHIYILLIGLKKNKNLSIKNKCFQYAVTIILNYEEIKRDPQRTTKLNLEGITGKE